jgi:CheY-like chemotaxis protein
MKKIVVADDQPIVGNIYRAKFSAAGFQVDIALDGLKALEVVERTNPDVLLLDLILPKADGLQVLRTLRANPSFLSLPIIVFTASGRPGIVEEAKAAGATLVLSKINTSPRQVIELVQKTLEDSEASNNNVHGRVAGKSGKDPEAHGSIVLIEHRADTRSIITHLLESAGHIVTMAYGHDEIISSDSAGSFDLFLISHGPAEFATSFCRNIRAQFADTPIVVYSMAALPSEKEEVLRAGATTYLTNPEDLLNIATIASGLIGQARVKLHQATAGLMSESSMTALSC